MGTIKLATEKSKVEADPLRYTWLIYGQPKIGKSTLASMMEDPYFIATEAAHRDLEIFKTDVEKWPEIEALVVELCKPDCKFKTIVFDTCQIAHEMLCNHLVEESGAENINDGPLAYGKGYREARVKFRNMLNFIAKSGKGVVLVAHEFLKDSNFQGREYSRYLPSLTKSERDAIVAPADMVGRMYADRYEQEGNMEYGRFISFQNTEEWEGGDRSGKVSKVKRILLPSPEECWKAIKAEFLRNKSKEVSRGAGRVSTG